MSDTEYSTTCAVCDCEDPPHELLFERDETTSVEIYLKINVCSDCVTRESDVIDAVTTFATENGVEITTERIQEKLNSIS